MNPKHPALQALWSYWRDLARGAPIPRRSDFDVLDVPVSAWPRVFMIDVLEGEKKYRFRVIGSYVVAAHKKDYTGRLVINEEIPNVTQTHAYRLIGESIASRAPKYFYDQTVFRFTNFSSMVEQIFLPLVDKDDKISSLVCALDFPDYSVETHQRHSST